MRLVFGVVVVTAVMSVAVVASAAPQKACPTNWDHVTVEEAAEIIWPHLLDPDALGSEENLAGAISVVADQNDQDGWICLKVFWGEHLNPNSHWYKVGVELTGAPTISFLTEPDNPNVTG